jgi:cytochrome oxidase assembly protein ShyY1
MGSSLEVTLIDGSAPVLVNRGWISKAFAQRSTRPASVDPGTTIIKGLSLFL